MMQVQARTLALDGAPLHDTTLVGGGQVFDAAVAVGPTCGYLVAFDDNATFGYLVPVASTANSGATVSTCRWC